MDATLHLLWPALFLLQQPPTSSLRHSSSDFTRRITLFATRLRSVIRRVQSSATFLEGDLAPSERFDALPAIHYPISRPIR